MVKMGFFSKKMKLGIVKIKLCVKHITNFGL